MVQSGGPDSPHSNAANAETSASDEARPLAPPASRECDGQPILFATTHSVKEKPTAPLPRLCRQPQKPFDKPRPACYPLGPRRVGTSLSGQGRNLTPIIVERHGPKKAPMSSSLAKSVSLALLLSIALPVAVVPALELDTERFMPLEEVQPGMTGVGRSVFQGTTIEEFDAEIISILKNAFPKHDLILARLSGGPIEEAGVIAGMSGSPVYIDGRMIGAVGYSFGLFPKEPIAGITPIEQMLELFEREDRSTHPQLTRHEETWEELLAGFVYSRASEPSHTARSLAETAAIRHPLPSGGGISPVRTPLVLSGFDATAISEMTSLLDRFGFIPIQGGAYSGEEAAEIPLEPGAVLGVQLVGGDASAFAIGTLTYREGDRILAFGHSMFNSGQAAAPITNGYVHLVLKSLYDSYKMGAPVGIVGTLGQDRIPGITGRLGTEPDLIPFDITVASPGLPAPETFHLEIFDDPIFAPQFVRWSLASIVRTTNRGLGNITLHADTEVELRSGQTLHLDNIFSDLTAIDAAGEELGTSIALLMLNPLERAQIARMQTRVAIEETLRTASIERLHLEQTRVHPEEEVALHIWLRPHLERPIPVQTRIAVPADVPDGTYQLIVSDAATAQAIEVLRATWRFIPTEFDQLLHLLEDQDRNDEIILTLILPRPGAVVRGEELPLLPPSVLHVMQPELEAGEGGMTGGKVVFRTDISTDFVITGAKTIPLTVDRSESSVRK